VSSERPKPLVHHELCFGCGRANLFGLLAELEPAGEARVRGRCFVKQDHQGAPPGTAHVGILAAALAEAISLAAGAGRHLRALEVRFEAPVRVGTFLELDASADAATAAVDGRPVASARASWG
jgi:acyl-coenzyme A thioesterase PaaI-like protein